MLASPNLIDDDAGGFFADVAGRIRAGASPAAALAAARAPILARDPGSWVREVIVFE